MSGMNFPQAGSPYNQARTALVAPQYQGHAASATYSPAGAVPPSVGFALSPHTTASTARTPQGYPCSLGIEWKGISFKIGDAQILTEVTGIAEPGRITAILGPSGSGKTTLMNVLSGRQRTEGKSRSGSSKAAVEFEGKTYRRGEEVSTSFFRGRTAYVFQDNSLLESDTAKECLEFSAYLRLPKDVSKEKRDDLVNELLVRLNLDGHEDVVVGSALRKGLSGGQQKRVAVGVELISDPKMLFLDEPLSGLDSYNAFSLVETLQNLARGGVPVMFTVHQPSSEIYEMLDDLIFLHAGEVIYSGPREDAVGHFASLGFRCPANYNPADYILFLIQKEQPEVVDNLKRQWKTSSCFKKLEHRIAHAGDHFDPAGAKAEERMHVAHDSDSDSDSEGENEAPQGKVFGKPKRSRGCCSVQLAILRRDGRHYWRDKATILSAWIQTLFVSAIYGWLFLGAGHQNGTNLGIEPSGQEQVELHPCSDDAYRPTQCQRAFQVHWGALGIVAINTMVGSISFAVTVFQQERSVFLREATGGYYSAFTYFASKSLFEIPIMGTCTLITIFTVYWMMGLNANPLVLAYEAFMLSAASSSIVFCLSAQANTPEEAMALSPIAQIPQFAFAGILLPNEMVPATLRWVKWLCPLYYGMNMMALSEWSDVFERYDACKAEAGGDEQVMQQKCRGTVALVSSLQSQGVSEGAYWWPAFCMCIILIIVFRLLGVFILWRKSRFVL
eukprot:TRINITY_DN33024_c0_g1_i1.p1 TRINITY_DN33024_c0_g1~~TRINITY_DN33024_c0_g1_i1.p1  ORF type:complete len:728 (+),score=136.63 TRINITY_DN33024_c0_g1_i1:88-2271(+)